MPQYNTPEWNNLIDRLRANDSTLTNLNLYSYSIGDAGAKDLSIALKNNRTVTRLDLGVNNIGDAGAKDLSLALKDNYTLTVLNLNLNNIGDAQLQEINKLIERNIVANNNNELKEVYRHHNNIKPLSNSSMEPIPSSLGQVSLSLNIPSADLTIGQKLGEGSFGVVYAGRWRFNDVAVKQLKNTQLSSKAIDEFTNEMQVMSRLRSSQIVQLYCITVDKIPYCLVMEYMPKGSLYTLLHSPQTLAWEVRENIALDMAKGLAYLHHEHILHRDLKSLNVLLDNQYRAKLTDFGLSQVKTETRTISSSTMVGSLQWMAPELFNRKAVCSEKSDMYSFAMTLWELAARELPFQDANGNQALVMQCVERGARDIIPQDTPPKLAKLISWGWSQKAEDRPTAVQVIEELNIDSSLPIKH